MNAAVVRVVVYWIAL